MQYLFHSSDDYSLLASKKIGAVLIIRIKKTKIGASWVIRITINENWCKCVKLWYNTKIRAAISIVVVVTQEKPWNLRFHGFFLTFLSFWWARSQAVSYHFYKMAPASFASPLPFPENHLIEACNLRLPDHKTHGNAWFASKQVAQSGSHPLCAVLPILLQQRNDIYQQILSCLRIFYHYLGPYR